MTPSTSQRLKRYGLELLAFLFLGGIFLYTFSRWDLLPNSVPRHFSLEGTPDTWGPKYLLWVTPASALILYGVLTGMILRHENWLRWPWKISPRNRPYLMDLGHSLLLSTKTLTLGALLYIHVETINIALGKAPVPGFVFLPVFIFMILGNLTYSFFRAKKYAIPSSSTPRSKRTHV